MSGFTMNDLAAGGMGDSLLIGPQYTPAANQGLPLVQRGPHGMRLAPPLNDKLQWWNESSITGPWQPETSIVGVMGLGGSDEPSSKRKAELTKLSKAVKETVAKAPASSEPANVALLGGMIATSRSSIAELDKYKPWDADMFCLLNCAISSQDIRANFQSAIQAATRKMQGQQWKSAEGPSQSPDVLTETARNVASMSTGQIAKEASDYYGGAINRMRKQQEEASRDFAIKAVAVGLVGLGIFAFFSAKGRGPTIQIGS